MANECVGVLFAGGMVHMLPEAQEKLAQYFKNEEAFPWFGAIAGAVFLVMFSIEFVFHGMEILTSLLIRL